MDDAVTTVRVARSYLAALNAHDPERVCEWVSEDFFNEHVSARGESVRGREAYRRRLDGFLRGFADLHYDIEDIVAEGGRAVATYRMTANFTGVSGGPRSFSLRGAFWLEVRDERVAHRIDYHDGVSFEEQVGLR